MAQPKVGHLLPGVLSHKVHLIRLIQFSCHLDSSVKQVHLVHKQVPEDSRAVDHHVDTRATQLLQSHHFKLVHSAQRIRHWLDSHHAQDL